MMTELEDKKLNQLFFYYVQNGFNHTIEEIAKSLKVSAKTLFNRYKNKNNMEREVILYWQNTIIRRLDKKALYCNNNIEVLLILICELVQSMQKETPFFEIKTKNLLCKNNYKNEEWDQYLHRIIESDKGRCFIPAIDLDIYSKYFWRNILFYISQKELSLDIISYLLIPILSENGLNYFFELDVESLVFGIEKIQ